MGKKNSSGFTIIEVSMVLAIAALLMIGIMVGISFAVQRQRFSDSVNSTQSYIQQQYNESQNAIINRNNDDPNCNGARGASDCLVLGKLIDLYYYQGSDDTYVMKTYDVIVNNADFDKDPYKSVTDIRLLINMLTPRSRDDDNEAFLVPWGATLDQPRDSSDTPIQRDSGTPVRYIAILRSPRTGELGVYKVNSLSDDVPNGDTLQFSELDGRVYTCISSAELSGTRALLEIGKTASQDGVTTKFDEATCS